MKIKHTPQYNGKTTEIEKLTEHSLKINGETYEFSNQDGDYPDISTETNGAIQQAECKDGVLWIQIFTGYSADEKEIWENPNFYETGGYRGSQWEDL